MKLGYGDDMDIRKKFTPWSQSIILSFDVNIVGQKFLQLTLNYNTTTGRQKSGGENVVWDCLSDDKIFYYY